jgi:hypothetical protein
MAEIINNSNQNSTISFTLPATPIILPQTIFSHQNQSITQNHLMASTKPIQPLHLIKPHHQARPSCYDHQSTPDFPCRTIITVNTPNPSPKLNQSPPSIPADHQHHKNHRPPHHRSQLYLAVDSSSPPVFFEPKQLHRSHHESPRPRRSITDSSP